MTDQRGTIRAWYYQRKNNGTRFQMYFNCGCTDLCIAMSNESPPSTADSRRCFFAFDSVERRQFCRAGCCLIAALEAGGLGLSFQTSVEC